MYNVCIMCVHYIVIYVVVSSTRGIPDGNIIRNSIVLYTDSFHFFPRVGGRILPDHGTKTPGHLNKWQVIWL